MNRGAVIGTVLLFLVAAAVIGWRESRRSKTAPVAAAPPAASPALPPAPPPAPPAVAHYAVPAADRAELPALDQSDSAIKQSLIEMIGRKAVAAFIRTDGVARRLVATINNLASDDAASHLWPVATTPGSFQTETRDGALVISPRNAERYAPFVRMAEGLDARRAVAVYFHFYPLLLRAYEDLGAPGKTLNDRVVEVIDNLLATPKVTGPIRVKRIGADGATTTGPGLFLYEDPALESATAGQKILLRVGPDNAAQLMTKLSELRAQLVAAGRDARK